MRTVQYCLLMNYQEEHAVRAYLAERLQSRAPTGGSRPVLG